MLDEVREVVVQSVEVDDVECGGGVLTVKGLGVGGGGGGGVISCGNGGGGKSSGIRPCGNGRPQ